MKAPPSLDIIFDGQCAFCRRVLRMIARLDWRRQIRFYDGRDESCVARLFPMLRQSDLERAMYAVSEHGEVFRGFFAFRRLVWPVAALWPMLILFYLPGASFIGVRVYDWVSWHRHELGCGSKACELPLPQQPFTHGSAKEARTS